MKVTGDRFYRYVFFGFTSCVPDATHPHNNAAQGVLLALWLLGVGETKVLPLAWLEEFGARFCLGQKPCFDFIIGVDTNPEAQRKAAIKSPQNEANEPFSFSDYLQHVAAGSHLNVRAPVEKSAHTWNISALEPMDMM